MSSDTATRCFTCGQPAGDPARFNHLPNGRPCPTCRDRLLESLAPLIPAAGSEAAALEREDAPSEPPPPAGPHPA